MATNEYIQSAEWLKYLHTWLKCIYAYNIIQTIDSTTVSTVQSLNLGIAMNVSIYVTIYVHMLATRSINCFS